MKSFAKYSRKYTILIAVYLVGCVLLYFGIPQSFIEFAGSRRWIYEPEPYFFHSLLGAAVFLIRPFLAVVICGWVIAIPILLVVGFTEWGKELWQSFRTWTNRGGE